MHSILMESEKYAIHVLSKNQVAHGVHFSKPAVDDLDQFENIPHEMNEDVTIHPLVNDPSTFVEVTGRYFSCRRYRLFVTRWL